MVKGISFTAQDKKELSQIMTEAWKRKRKKVKAATKPVNLVWDKLHIQSREEILIGAGMRKHLAIKKWSELDTWQQILLRDSLKIRSAGKAHL